MSSRYRACGFILFRRSTSNSSAPEILLLKNIKSGKWAPPKGGQEEGESDIETAYREILEETGIEKHQIIHHSDYEHTISYPHGNEGRFKKSTFFLGELKGDQNIVLSHEHLAVEWMNFERAIEHAKIENYKTVYSVFRDIIAKL